MNSKQEARERRAEATPRTRLPLYAFYTGNAISYVGDMLTFLAVPWFVLQTTGSVTQTGPATLTAGTNLTYSLTVRDAGPSDAKNVRLTVARNKIDSIQESPVSLMPENLLKDLRPAEVRDLFGYLQSDKRPSSP